MLKKLTKKVCLIALLAICLVAGSVPAYARVVIVETSADGRSWAGVRCGDGDINGDFTVSYNANTDEWSFVTLTRAEAAYHCGYNTMMLNE